MKHTIKFISALILLIFVISSGVKGQTTPAMDAEARRDLTNKGIEAYRKKDYQSFLNTFLRLHKQFPRNWMFLYNTACGYSLTNQKTEAITALRQLIALDANPQIKTEKDFNPIRNTPEFKQVIKELDDILRPVSNSQVAFTITEKDLHPESIAYDSVTKRFYLGSIRKKKIVYIDTDGSVKDFVGSNQDRLLAVFGLRIDAKNRTLWAVSSAIPQMEEYDSLYRLRTYIYKYNLDNRQLIKKYFLKKKEAIHFFKHIALAPSGEVYVSDINRIYRINPKTDELEELVTDNRFNELQGLAVCANGKKLMAADPRNGILIIDIPSRKVLGELTHDANLPLNGIDGLEYYEKSNSLIAIQGALNPMRVMQFFLNPDCSSIISANTIEKANPHFNIPTMGTISNGNQFYYIANSQWRSYEPDGTIFRLSKLKNIIILKATLK